jgi:2-polyprenyl-3-methyl-5-hydroxy-6-metoxy-1,4-benzoquinol methylase
MDGPARARTTGYESAREDVLALLPLNATNVLDIGCSSGALGAALKSRQTACVVGVEPDPVYAREASARLDRVVAEPVESFLVGPPPAEAPFDCLVCADVLEHLVDPWRAVQQLVRLLAPGATAIVSVPNVLWYRSLRRLVVERRWPLEDQGIYDRTHLRWFSLSDANALVTAAGLEVVSVEFRYWEPSRVRTKLLIWSTGTPLAPFAAAQHILVCVKS